MHRIPRFLRLHFSKPLELLPARGLSLTHAAGRHTDWAMLEDDSQFELIWRPSMRLPRGTYHLRIEIPRGARHLVSPRLYINSGGGYSEGETWPVRPSERSGVLEAIMRLPQGAIALRFDPSESPGSLALGRVLLRRLDPISKRRMAPRLPAIGRAPNDYKAWIARNERLSPEDLAEMRREVEALPDRPLISVLMPVYDTPEDLLRAAIESVRQQVYDRWELCIADDGSTNSNVRKLLARYAAADPRIKVVFRAENGHISRASNSALELVTGEWVALLDHDDLLRPHSLAEVAFEIARHPDAELIYSDEDKLDVEGDRYDPYFKPDFSRELFRSQNYLNHLTVHRTANIRAVGGWRPGFEGSQDYDLNLRIFERIDPARIRHIPKVLYHWRAVSGSTAAAGSEKGYAYEAGFRALKEHVERMSLAATVEEIPGVPFYRLRFAVPEPQPLVSLIIPTRDRADLLKQCIDSILRKTTYQNYEIVVVDNGSEEPETLAYFEALEAEPKVRILCYDAPFNYSAINNFAVERVNGEIVGLINNDIEVITPDWLTEMVSWAVQPDIGCVGAKLYYPNDTIQHAGVILGVGGVANHAHLDLPKSSPGYFGRAVVTNNYSAVTAACLLISRGKYMDIGGLDARNLPVAFNDVDFCLRVRGAHYWNVWTPFAELYHMESATRGKDFEDEKRRRFEEEVGYMQRRWNLSGDPFYSPNLSRYRPDFSFNFS